jgi:hypothetical protein
MHRSMSHQEAFFIRDWLLANDIQAFIRTDDPLDGQVGVWVLEGEAKAAEQLFYTTQDPRIRAVGRVPWYHTTQEMYEPPDFGGGN